MTTEVLDDATIGELLALITHDLRNPLSALHSNLGFLESALGGADDDSREALVDALVSCDGLLHIIDNLELLAQRLRGSASPSSGPVALGALVSTVVDATRAMAQSHGVTLLLTPNPEATALLVDSNRDFLARAVANVIRNAVQHGASGAVHVGIEQRGGDRAIVWVTDSGTPLAGTQTDSAFLARGQIDAKATGKGRYSRGLGLFSAALAASGAKATLLADSSAGSRFEISIALAR